MGSLYKRGNVWWIKYSDRKGKVIRESTKSTKKMVATRMLERREGEIAEGKMPSIYFERTTYDQLADDLENDYRINGQGVRHVKNRRLHLDEAFGGMSSVQITTAVIKGYIADRLEAGASNATVNRELAALKRMYRLGAQQTPPIVANVPYIPMLKEKNRRKGFVEHSQFKALHAAAPSYLKGFLQFGYLTGWRKGEDIDPDLVACRPHQLDRAPRTG